jgi:NDP-sugar pyrophosphorylase family protein
VGTVHQTHPAPPGFPGGQWSRPSGYHAEVPEVSDVIGIGLAGGQGVRARPLTLKAPGYLRSKAAMAFLGRRLIRWVVMILSAEGVKEYYIVAHGKENRYQIKVLLRYGEELGVDVRYSPVKYDALNTGSADSTLRMMDHWELDRPMLVFPTDSIIDFDLEPMYRHHVESGAAVTIAAMTRAPTEVAEKYGVMLSDPDRRILEFVEKPTLAELREHFAVRDQDEFDRLPLLTNAGFYLLDPGAMRRAMADPELASIRRARLDFGKDLLPWLVEKGYTVVAHPVRRIGDLGNVEDYVETGVEVLRGDFESVIRQMGPPLDPDSRVWIAPESLHMRDEWTGKTLAEKMAEGLVTIGPAVRIGRYCEIGPGVVISDSNLDDDVEVRGGAYISRSMIRDGAIVGAGATIRNTVIGSMSEVRSQPDNPTVLEQYVALGDEVVVHAGAHLSDHVSVYPRLKIPAGIRVPPGRTLASADDILDLL